MISAQDAAKVTQEVRERSERKIAEQELVLVEGKIIEATQSGSNSCCFMSLLPQTLQVLNDNDYKVNNTRGEFVISW